MSRFTDQTTKLPDYQTNPPGSTGPAQTVIDAIQTAILLKIMQNGAKAARYEHLQDAASDTWIVNHNLGYRPIVDIVTLSGQNQYIGYEHVTTNTLRVLAEVECTGRVICF